ncbi:hypothetical protein JVW24_22255, partial [Vibrio cholerae O1]|nr:hypothetical protein [Vibrio cholerae O1]
RGGALVYPEESMEGFTASARDGFLPEMDIQFLRDGTPSSSTTTPPTAHWTVRPETSATSPARSGIP